MKVTQRIPTEQYAYMEFEGEYENLEDAFKEHRMLCRRTGRGLDQREWVSVSRQMYRENTFDPNLFHKLNADQQFFINELKKRAREVAVEEPVIN